MNNLSIATKILKPLETSSSLGMFARDTGGCLLARVGLSRTKNEAKEVTFAEISESAIFYFSAPALAKATSKLFSKLFKIDKKDFNTPINELNTLKNSKNLKLGKFAQIASTFSIILPFVFAIAPVRNLLTLANSGSNKFTSLVGLDKKKNEKENDENKKEALSKAKNLIKKLGAISAVSLFSVLAILGISKNDKIYKKIEPALNGFIKKLEFTKEGDLSLWHYGALIYPVSVLSYFSACRDKYEVLENIRRFSVTIPLLFFGEDLIQNPIYKFFDKKNNTKVMDKGAIKSYDEILKMPQNLQKNHLKTKSSAYASTFLINTIAIAAAVAALNRFETKRKYAKDNKNTHFQTLKPINIELYKNLTKGKIYG